MNLRFDFVAAGFFFLVVLVGMKHVADKLESMESEVSIHNDLLSGKAQYMPGAACVIATGPDTTPAQIVNFARACAKSHESWLESRPVPESPEALTSSAQVSD